MATLPPKTTTICERKLKYRKWLAEKAERQHTAAKKGCTEKFFSIQMNNEYSKALHSEL